MGKPPIVASLVWESGSRFSASSAGTTLTLDGDGAAGPSPMQALAIALAGCMAIDVVDIITKGRHPLTSLEASLEAERAETPPRYFVRIHLKYLVRGDVPAHVVDRAIALSRDKYCSVWHSMRHDIAFMTSYEVEP